MHKAEEAVEERLPWLSEYLSHNFGPDASQFKERNVQRLEVVKKIADDRLLTQSAARPTMIRLRYVGCVLNTARPGPSSPRRPADLGPSPARSTFDQASPNNIEVGTQADLSDLVVKSPKDDAAALQ